MILLLILLFSPAALAQYSGYNMKADLAFNEYNDRFDLDALMKDQNKMYPEPKHSEEYRRKNLKKSFSRRKHSSISSSSEGETYTDQALNPIEVKPMPIKKLFVPVLDMQAPTVNVESKDFAFHDNMESGFETNYEKQMKPFQKSRRNLLNELMNELHGGKGNGRRNMEGVDPEQEVLFHHGVPVKISIDGFIELPHQLA